MELAANYLIGKHDFSTFRSSICQASSPVKTIDTIDIQSEKIRDGIIYQLNFSARYKSMAPDSKTLVGSAPE